MSKKEIRSYSYSKITLCELQSIIDIELKLSHTKFDHWFNDKSIELNNKEITLLEKLITKHDFLIASYKEETLKMKFISPILNQIEFDNFEKKICDFYDEVLTYRANKFILTGKVDYMVSEGDFYPKKPYFFIQEFKPSSDGKNPQPQLLAELVSAIELNQFSTIKGAFIIGITWHFVILEKIGNHKYQYFMSKSYDCTDIEKLKAIYKNLCYVKQEIFDLQDGILCIQYTKTLS